MRRIFIVLLLVSLFLTACSAKKTENQVNPGNTGAANIKPLDVQEFHMGTIISQRIYGDKAEAAAREVFDRIKWLEDLLTINAPGGDINLLNSQAGKDKVKLQPETIHILEKANKYAELSGGAFDVTVGPLVEAWGVFTDHPRIPPQPEIDDLKKLVGYKDLKIYKDESSAMLGREGQIVDVGGIAKGYAGDEAISIYKKYGIKSAYVNLGGNVVAMGSKPDGTPWKIGIQNPRAPNGIYLGIIKVTDKAIVSSGDYERFFEENGKRYHHIIDPKTGYPAESGLIATTIVAPVSVDADALSTAAFVLGLEKGRQLIESLDGVEAIFITSDKKIYTTSGLKGNFILEDESKEFIYDEKG